MSKARSEVKSEATSGRLLVMWICGMCEERSDELKGFLAERRYGMLFILSLRFLVLLSLRSSRPSLRIT